MFNIVNYYIVTSTLLVNLSTLVPRASYVPLTIILCFLFKLNFTVIISNTSSVNTDVTYITLN